MAGLLTGLVTTFVIYPLFFTWQQAYLGEPMANAMHFAWIVGVVIAVLIMGGAWLAVRWSGSSLPVRCAALGGLAGGLAGTIVFCLWGAALAGWIGPAFQLSPAICQSSQINRLNVIVGQTLGVFLWLFGGGIGLGALSGWLVRPRQPDRADVFDMAAPQMAMNASITAVPASMFAAAISVAMFSNLAKSLGGQTGELLCARTILDMPLAASKVLVLISHFALTLVIPHEARQAEHRSGMDEVKMAAYVGILASPVWILLLIFIDKNIFSSPWVVAGLLAATGMSLKSLHTLFRLILPRRKTLPAPVEDWQKTEAKLFGSIAKSRGPRLVALCIGCGLAMVLPLYVLVLSVVFNMNAETAPTLATLPQIEWSLFVKQALVSAGLVTASITFLSAIYLFYLNLGRWFSRWNARRIKL